MGFYDEKENLLNAENAMNSVTARFNKQLNQFDKQTLKITDAIYAFRRFKVEYYTSKKEKANEQDFKEQCSKEIKDRFNIKCKPENVDSFIAMISEKAKPVLEFIENYKKELQKTYMEHSSVLRCAISSGNVEQINAVYNKENQFNNELINGVFASSGFSDLENYIGRSAAEGDKGYGMKANNPVVVYPDNPFKEIEEQEDDNSLLLKKDVYIYSMDANKFEPVVDFKSGRDGTYSLNFGQEWISRNESLECEQETVDRVPREILERKQFFYQKQGVTDKEIDVHSKGEFLDKYSKLIASGKLGYINGEFNIHSISELSDTQNTKVKENKKMAYQKKPKKVITEDELKGIIVKGEGSYSLRNMGQITRITRVNDIKFIDGLDIEEHNKRFLEEIKAKRDNYGEDGYNELGFNEEGMHRNGTEISDEGYNSKGWVTIEFTKDYDKPRDAKMIKPLNSFTGSDRDLDGFDKYGFDIEGYNVEGYDKDGYDRDNINEQGFNREGIHKETGTKYGPDGYTQDGIDENGYNREQRNKNGKTKEEVDETKQQQRKNFLGLRELAQGYAKGTISIEDYLKNHKISIDELIDFAKKQDMDKDTIVGLYKKKTEYNQHKRRFNKAQYLKEAISINGVPVTEEMVDTVLQYLKDNDRLLSNKIVQEHIRKYANGELEISPKDNTVEEKKEEHESTEPYINESGEIIRPGNGEETKPIAENISSSIFNMAKDEKSRDVVSGQKEVKTNYKEYVTPTIEIEDNKMVDDD